MSDINIIQWNDGVIVHYNEINPLFLYCCHNAGSARYPKPLQTNKCKYCNNEYCSECGVSGLCLSHHPFTYKNVTIYGHPEYDVYETLEMLSVEYSTVTAIPKIPK